MIYTSNSHMKPEKFTNLPLCQNSVYAVTLRHFKLFFLIELRNLYNGIWMESNIVLVRGNNYQLFCIGYPLIVISYVRYKIDLENRLFYFDIFQFKLQLILRILVKHFAY